MKCRVYVMYIHIYLGKLMFIECRSNESKISILKGNFILK